MKIKLLKSLLLASGITVAGPNISSEILIDMDVTQPGIQSTIILPDTGTTFSAAIIARNVTDLLGCEFTLKTDTTKFKFISGAYGSAFDNSMPDIYASDSSSVTFTYARMALTPQYLTASEAQLGIVTLKNKAGYGGSGQIEVISGKFSSAGPEFDDFTTVTYGTYSVVNPQYSVIVSTAIGGTISSTSISAIYNTVSGPITATPDGCHTFKSWEVVSGNIAINSASTATTTVTAQSSGEIRATFSPIQYTLTVNSDINGTASGSGIYDCGVQPTIIATPNPGFVFANWTIEGNGIIQNALSANTIVSLSGAATIQANFIPLLAARNFSPKIPQAYNLSVSGATVQYTVPKGKQDQIRFRIMNMSGKLITEHLESASVSGYFRFDLKNLQKGCYICTMKAGDFSKTVKVFLAR